MTATAPSSAAHESFTYHGGNLGAAQRLFTEAPTPWIDLSTGVNPHPYPLPALAPEAWTRLPDAGALKRLEAVAAARYQALQADSVVAAGGSQQIIQTLAGLLPGPRVGVLGRTYSGHARAWEAAGAEVTQVGTLAALSRYDVAVVVNPNNPDGRILTRASLLTLRQAMERDAVLIVDEAFLDLEDTGQSLASAPLDDGVVVLRSFGKTYGLAGLRLGFAIAAAGLAAQLRAALGPWAVSGPAIAIGALALADDAWLEAARARLTGDAARLDDLLETCGWTPLGGCKLFRLARRDDAAEGFARLLRHGVLARPFADAINEIRFGLPASPEQWRRLEVALTTPAAQHGSAEAGATL